MKFSTLALVFLIACSGRPAKIAPGYLEPNMAHRHRIIAGHMFLAHQEWVSSPWYRVTDTELLPVFILIDRNGYACLVPAEVWALSPEYSACPTPWRRAR